MNILEKPVVTIFHPEVGVHRCHIPLDHDVLNSLL